MRWLLAFALTLGLVIPASAQIATKCYFDPACRAAYEKHERDAQLAQQAKQQQLADAVRSKLTCRFGGSVKVGECPK